MRLIRIPQELFEEYRYEVMLNGYKWDPQWKDTGTISQYAVVLSANEAQELEQLTQRLTKETIEAEQFLKDNLRLCAPLALPRQIKRQLGKLNTYNADNHLRLMRFDFHPIEGGGYAVSEVNSDVPGGFAEASLMPRMVAGMMGYGYRDFGESFCAEFCKKLAHGKVAMVHCTAYSDDRQAMQFLGDRLAKEGYEIVYCAADHIVFKEGQAWCVLEGFEGKVDAIVRFTPLDWLVGLPKEWHGYFTASTMCCNSAVAVFAQTKRFPLVWSALERHGIELGTWKELLPTTLDVRHGRGNDFILKPVSGRVGEGITIKGTMSKKELNKVRLGAILRPKKYVAQRLFHSAPLVAEDGTSLHICIGVYSIEGRAAGFYARANTMPRIESSSQDIAVLVEGQNAAEYKFCAKDSRGLRAYRAWAGNKSPWGQWVRPVPFVAGQGRPAAAHAQLSSYGACSVQQFDRHTAIICDLSDVQSVEEGLALAQLGWQPVPLFNSSPKQAESVAQVQSDAIEDALMQGAELLERIQLKEDAPPAFLLDFSRRLRRKVRRGIFDNSWYIYPQDMPSAKFLVSKDIKRIILYSPKKSKDIMQIIKKYKKAGIELQFIKSI